MLRRTNRLMAAGLAAGVFVLGLSIYNLSSAQDRAAGKKQPAGEAARGGKGAAAQAEGREGARGARGEAAAAEHGAAETGGQAGPLSVHDISLQQAHQVVEAAVKKSMEI